MQESNLQLWFQSDRFEIHDGEDEETNPLCYGRELSLWLCNELKQLGYETELIPEDWGWCVVCRRKPFLLWVGCVSVHDYAASKPDDPVPEGSEVIWTCIVVAEPSFLSRIFSKPDTEPAKQELFAHVRELLKSKANVTFEEQPA